MKTRGVYEAKTRFIDDQRQWRDGHNITLGHEVAIREFTGDGQETLRRARPRSHAHEPSGTRHDVRRIRRGEVS
jgi:hypothetical protein